MTFGDLKRPIVLEKRCVLRSPPDIRQDCSWSKYAYRLTQSEFWCDVTISRWRLWHHFTQKNRCHAVNAHAAYPRRLCSSVRQFLIYSTFVLVTDHNGQLLLLRSLFSRMTVVAMGLCTTACRRSQGKALGAIALGRPLPRVKDCQNTISEIESINGTEWHYCGH